MSLSSIQALPPELKVIIAGYLDLPSLAALRRASRTFSFIQPILYQRDSQQYPLYALPHAIRKGNIQWMELALNALKPDLQSALQYTSLAATQGSEQMLQRFLETVLEFTSENERGAVIEEACFSTLKDYRRDPQLQILLSYLPNFSWLHIFSRKVQLHDEALRTALDELVSQSCHPVAQEYLHRATELVDTGPDFQIWRLLFQYMSRCNAPDQIRKLLEAVPPAPSASEQSSVYDDWQSAVYIASVNGYTTNFKALFGWGSLVVPSADYRQAWFFVLHWTCTDHREASIRELHSIAVESTLGPKWLPTVPLDLEEFRKQVDGNRLLKWEKFVRKGDHQ